MSKLHVGDADVFASGDGLALAEVVAGIEADGVLDGVMLPDCEDGVVGVLENVQLGDSVASALALLVPDAVAVGDNVQLQLGVNEGVAVDARDGRTALPG